MIRGNGDSGVSSDVYGVRGQHTAPTLVPGSTPGGGTPFEQKESSDDNMNVQERLEYTTSTFREQLPFATIRILGETDWAQQERSKYKQYGVLPPVQEGDEWVVSLWPELMNLPVQLYSDEEFALWVEYWVANIQFHFVMFAWSKDLQELGEYSLTPEDIDTRVDFQIEGTDPDAYTFSQTIKALMRQ